MKYISLGYFCAVANELEKLGLRNESSPFDWILTDFEGVMAVMQEHFADFLDYEYLVQDKNRREIYTNTKYNIGFYHDFDKYRPLADQLPAVREKYNRRISRFYQSIAEPTLFVRYISDEHKLDGKSTDLTWIENNYEEILALLKSFNAQNDILFIANEGVCSDKIVIYNVRKDENDVVARNPIHDNAVLFALFSSFDHPNKQANIERYHQKQNVSFSRRLKKKFTTLLKRTFLKEYIHEKQR